MIQSELKFIHFNMNIRSNNAFSYVDDIILTSTWKTLKITYSNVSIKYKHASHLQTLEKSVGNVIKLTSFFGTLRSHD